MAPELTPGEALDRGGTAYPHIPGTPAPPVVSGTSSPADSSAEPTRRRRGPEARLPRGRRASACLGQLFPTWPHYLPVRVTIRAALFEIDISIDVFNKMCQ